MAHKMVVEFEGKRYAVTEGSERAAIELLMSNNKGCFEKLDNPTDECKKCCIARHETELREALSVLENDWSERYRKQGEIMAGTARRNVRLEDEIAQLKKLKDGHIHEEARLNAENAKLKEEIETLKMLKDGHMQAAVEMQNEDKSDRLLIADLYACCRRMQMQLHDINAQTLCLESIAKEMKNPMLDKVKKNIEGYTECIYAEGGYLGFPPIVETIERAAVKLLELGETRHWSDYIGFDERMEDFEDQYGHLREKYAKIDAERKNESY